MSKPIINMDLERYVNEMRKMGLAREKRGNIAVLCPECYKEHKQKGENNYRKLKLWIEDGYNYGHCFRCHTIFLSNEQQINTTVKKLESPVDMNNWSLCKLGEEGFWKLSKFETFDEHDEEGVNYLARKRLYIYRKMYESLGIRFYKHNPVIPFYYRGELIFYQIRIIDPGEGMKYFTPPTEHKNPYILEHGENKKFVICEGVFDAIACRVLYPDRTPFAVLGSDITDYQIAMLRTYCPEDIMIYMDKTSLSESIQDSIMKYINYADISIHKSDGQDPEEFLKEKLIQDA